MTTNAGAQQMSRTSMGFTAQDHAGDDVQEIKKLFSPEFRNRLDAIIPFKPLSPDTIGHVVSKFVLELEAQLEEKHVEIDVDERARAWLARNGYDPTMGARPMARLIREKIKKALADEILFGRLAHGGHVAVTEAGGELAFTFEARETAGVEH
jgi:ATP-dependent Clp protease ATP-binding subunit ClpA